MHAARLVIFALVIFSVTSPETFAAPPEVVRDPALVRDFPNVAPKPFFEVSRYGESTTDDVSRPGKARTKPPALLAPRGPWTPNIVIQADGTFAYATAPDSSPGVVPFAQGRLSPERLGVLRDLIATLGQNSERWTCPPDGDSQTAMPAASRTRLIAAGFEIEVPDCGTGTMPGRVTNLWRVARSLVQNPKAPLTAPLFAHSQEDLRSFEKSTFEPLVIDGAGRWWTSTARGQLDPSVLATLREAIRDAHLVNLPQEGATCAAVPMHRTRVDLGLAGEVSWEWPCAGSPHPDVTRLIELAHSLTDLCCRDHAVRGEVALELRGPAQVVIGTVATFELVNVDRQDLVLDQFDVCHVGRLELQLWGPAGPLYDVRGADRSEELDPAARIVLRPGESATVTFDTTGLFTTTPPQNPGGSLAWDPCAPLGARPEGKPLTPGHYTLSLTQGRSTSLGSVPRTEVTIVPPPPPSTPR